MPMPGYEQYGDGWLIVFNYDPAGNYIGQYADNVMPPKSVDNCGVTEELTTEESTTTTTVAVTEPTTTTKVRFERVKPTNIFRVLWHKFYKSFIFP